MKNCKECINIKGNSCRLYKMYVSVNAEWCKDFKLKFWKKVINWITKKLGL